MEERGGVPSLVIAPTDDELNGEEWGFNFFAQTRRAIWPAPFGIRSPFCSGTKPFFSHVRAHRGDHVNVLPCIKGLKTQPLKNNICHRNIRPKGHNVVYFAPLCQLVLICPAALFRDFLLASCKPGGDKLSIFSNSNLKHENVGIALESPQE
jgi:hypothetical protein